MKRIYTVAAALLFLGACTSDGYTIRGNVEGLEISARNLLAAAAAL